MSNLSTSNKFIVIDGHSLLYRAFFGTRFLTTSDGKPTNAVYGFLNMFLTLLENELPSGILVAFDAPAKNFRHAEYTDYKAHRKEAVQEFIDQIPMTKQLISAFGIPVVELIGYEADDVVGTVAIKAKNAGYHAIIVTGDMDELQLVQDNITVIATIKGVTDIHRFDRQAVYNKLSLYPEQVTDYKALRGDPSDNIPGIAGVGEKTATALLQQFGSIDNMYQNLDKIENAKLREKVRENEDICRKSKFLATIVTDAPVDYEPENFNPTEIHMNDIFEQLEKLEFKTAQRRIPAILMKLGMTKTEPIIVSEPLKVNIYQNDPPKDTRLTQLSVSTDGATFAVAVNSTDVYCFTMDWFMPEWFTKALSNPSCKLITDNGKFFYTTTAKNNISTNPILFDPIIGAYVIDPSRANYLVNDLSAEYLQLEYPQNLTQSDKLAYDASAVFQLYEPMQNKINAQSLSQIFNEIEMPIVPILVDMEINGIKVDPAYLQTLSTHLSHEMDKAAVEIYALAGKEFNIGSPKQLGDILFGEMNIAGAKKTKTGAYSTNADILAQLAPNYPIAQKVLDWREMQKLKGTYADALPALIADDGRIHTTFLQSVAATGRLSSQDPNLQNIPIKTEIGREIRRAFVADEGNQLLSIDYSQIELRLLAHICGDTALVEAFEKGLDIHTATATQLFNIPLENVNKDQRRIAKTVNFAVLYGMSDYGLSQELSIGVSEAHTIISDYFARFPKIKQYTETAIKQAREQNFTTTLLGRRRYFPELNSGNRIERQAAERAAVNAPIQGTAADLMKIAMIQVCKQIKGSPIKLLLQVHDELIFECPETIIMETAKKLAEVMRNCYQLKVPLEVESKAGKNWRDMIILS